jgi:hypothetical protein
MWDNPLFPTGPRPDLDPWTSPGRISLAPEVSAVERMTWEAASFDAVRPWMRRYEPWARDLLRAMLLGAIEAAAVWTLPDDPLDPFDLAQWWRPVSRPVVNPDPAPRTAAPPPQHVMVAPAGMPPPLAIGDLSSWAYLGEIGRSR